jgi:hypothetical protein
MHPNPESRVIGHTAQQLAEESKLENEDMAIARAVRLVINLLSDREHQWFGARYLGPVMDPVH